MRPWRPGCRRVARRPAPTPRRSEPAPPSPPSSPRGAFTFALGGGLGLDAALRRALRAALLVLTATWLRAAAGAEGLREVSRRALHRIRRIPAAPEASSVLDRIDSEGRLAAAARTLTAR